MSRRTLGIWLTWITMAAPTALRASADVVTDWNQTACRITAAANLPPPAGYRVMAIVQAAVLKAVEAVSAEPGADADARLAAAVAGANRRALEQLLPSQQSDVQRAFERALAAIPERAERAAALKLGEARAEEVLAARGADGAAAPGAYRPETAAGRYVPTAEVVVPQWPGRKPWILERADQFRPDPPPALDSERWAADFGEVCALGGRVSARRSAEQTNVAMFWQATAPEVYFSILRSAAAQPGRDPARNARLLASAAVAMDDALIATFEAKYHYAFWRPVTAIRNGDRDGRSDTERDAGWTPLIETPMHPEYPAAHCALAGAVSAVLKTEFGSAPLPLVSTSPSDAGVTRRWSSLDQFVREVGDARVWAGVHYRNSTEVGAALGARVGALVANSMLRASAAASANEPPGRGRPATVATPAGKTGQ